MTHKKFAELDGMRGIAVIAVMLLHSVLLEPWSIIDRLAIKFTGFGWAGVDLFFVLSGFLITGILFDSKNDNRYFRNFYGRRALRIFPLYFVYVGCISLVAYFLNPMTPGAETFRETVGWYWLYGNNFLVASTGEWTPLGTAKLWSLAIEEQFYFLWPLLVWALSRKRLMQACIALIIAVFALRAGLLLNDVSLRAIYVLTPTRMDTLMAGAFMALLLRGPSTASELTRIAKYALFAGAALVATAVVLGKGRVEGEGFWMQFFGYSGNCLAAAALILYTRIASEDSLYRRFLRSKFLTFYGKYSYAMYLLSGLAYLPLAPYLPDFEKLPTLGDVHIFWVLAKACIMIAATTCAALLSWHLLEKPCLSLKDRWFGSSRVMPRSALPAAVD